MAIRKKKSLLKTRLRDNSIVGIHPETETSQVVDLSDKYYNKSQVDTKLSGKMNTIAIDNTPTDGSTNLITSDGVYDAIQGFIEQPDVTNALTPYAKIVYVDTKLNTKQDKLTFDSAPTDASNNPVTSGGIFNAIKNKADKSELTNFVNTTALNAALLAKQDVLTFDESPTDGSDNPVKSKGIFNTLKSYAKKSELPTKTSELTNDSGFLTAHQDISGKQDLLTFDENPTDNSDNPVKSKGIFNEFKKYIKPAEVDTKLAPYAKTAEVDNKLNLKQNKLSFDETPTATSDNPVKSKGIKSYVDTAIGAAIGNIAINLDMDDAPTATSNNPVKSKGIYNALQSKANTSDLAQYVKTADIPTIIANKQDKLTFDENPTQDSGNPVYSGGVWRAIDTAKKDINISNYYNKAEVDAKLANVQTTDFEEMSEDELIAIWGSTVQDANGRRF
jgi:hypothetical protein